MTILILCLTLVFSSCAANPAATNNQTTAPTTQNSTEIKADDLMAGVQAAAWPQTPGALDAKTAAAINRFAARLLAISAENKGNVMVSPASVFLALGMTLNGADHETKTAMLEVLADQGITVDMVNEASRDWMTLLTQTGAKTSLAIANSIWFRDGFEPDLTFLQNNADYFQAGARRLDFNDEASTDVINGWVKEATRGTIEKIVEKISPSTVMYLINAIYFKSEWTTPFEENETYEMNFNAPAGAVKTYFLHRTDKMSYFTGNDASGVALPYDDGQFTYFALLPDGEVTPREWLAAQNPDELFGSIAGFMAQKSNFTVALAMPRFDATYEDTLNNELSALGMGIAFDPEQADFSKLNAAHSLGLYISEVRHKTFIRVDEKGTEASAVTSVAIDESADMSDIQLTFDRPFIYGIVDRSTGIPLFVGILEDPS